MLRLQYVLRCCLWLRLGKVDGSMNCREKGRDLMEALFRNFPGKSEGATSKIGMYFLTIKKN